MGISHRASEFVKTENKKMVKKLILKGKGFILRHFTLKDLQDYFECQQDKQTQKGFMSTPRNVQEAKKELLEKIADYKKKKPFGESFVIEVGGKFAGYVEIHHLNKKFQGHHGAVGYCAHPKYRGKGITTKAVKLLTKYAFKKYKLKKISGKCRTFNKSSARVLEKAGFKLEGILRKNKFKDGKYLDDMVWSKIK